MCGPGDGHFDEHGGGHHHLHISHLQPLQKRTASEPPRPSTAVGLAAARRALSPPSSLTTTASSDANHPASANLSTISEQPQPNVDTNPTSADTSPSSLNDPPKEAETKEEDPIVAPNSVVGEKKEEN